MSEACGGARRDEQAMGEARRQDEARCVGDTLQRCDTPAVKVLWQQDDVASERKLNMRLFKGLPALRCEE